MAYIQGQKKLQTGSDTCALAFDSNVTAGNFIIISFRVSSTTFTVTGVTDNQSGGGNTYQLVDSQVQTTDGHKHYVYYAENIKETGPCTVSVVMSGVSTICLIIHEYGGVYTSSSFDQKNKSQQDGTTTPNSGSVNTTFANELLYVSVSLGGDVVSNTCTAGTNYTKRQELNTGDPYYYLKVVSEEQIVSSIGTYSGTFTLGTAENVTTIIATFKLVTTAAVTGPFPTFRPDAL